MPGVHVLMYHDIQAAAQTCVESSPYTVSAANFALQMSAIAEKVGSAPLLFPSLLAGDLSEQPGPNGWMITFDDGKTGSVLAADILDTHGWRGHFFVITDRIGTPGFLDQAQLLDLHRRGHIIGTHSASHPRAMASLPFEDTVTEWRRSCDVLFDLLGRAVPVGAVPGGSYSRAVAAAAARAGITTLFISEPSSGGWHVDGCMVMGRYLVRHGTSEAMVAGLAGGKILPRCMQMARWKMRNAAVTVLGSRYETARACMLGAKTRRQRPL